MSIRTLSRRGGRARRFCSPSGWAVGAGKQHANGYFPMPFHGYQGFLVPMICCNRCFYCYFCALCKKRGVNRTLAAKLEYPGRMHFISIATPPTKKGHEVHSEHKTRRTNASIMIHMPSVLVSCRATCILIIGMSLTLVSLSGLIFHRNSPSSGASQSVYMRKEN